MPGRPRGGAANSAKERWHESFTLELDWKGRISYKAMCTKIQKWCVESEEFSAWMVVMVASNVDVLNVTELYT